MTSRPLLTAAALVLAAACAHLPSHLHDAPGAMPEDLAPHVEQAVHLGVALYEQDVVSARASDVLVDAKVIPQDDRLAGWISLPDRDGSWRVDFVTESGGALAAAYEVTFEPGSAVESDVEAFHPPRPLEPRAAAMFRARQAVLARVERRCGTGVNPAVLPASLAGEDGWLVYALAATNRPGEVVLSGHRLFRVSPDGNRILEEVPLSRSCQVETEKQLPEGAHPAALVVSHAVSDWPLETHVFTSLLYDTDLYVGTPRGVFEVSGDHVSFLGR